MAEQPSMDEILASIRRILSTETSGSSVTQPSPVVELTESMCVPAQPVPQKTIEKPMSVAQPQQIAPVLPVQAPVFKAPETKVAEPMPIPQPSEQPKQEEPEPTPQETQALDSVFMNVLKPLLREWLDKNMPRLLEKCIRQELQETKKENNDNPPPFSF